jgi:hypothetical protein
MAGYPRIVGGRYYPGTGVTEGYVAGVEPPAAPGEGGSALVRVGPNHPLHPNNRHMLPHSGGGPRQGHQIQRPPWRDMNAPGSPPLGEGHVPMPMNAEAFGGTWGAGGAAAGVQITFSARPQKPYKMTRFLATGTKVGTTAVGRLVGQIFCGTDLQQGELGNIDLETLGAGGSFDTWVSFKQAEPGVWIRAQGTLTAFPVAPDFQTYNLTAVGHYLH